MMIDDPRLLSVQSDDELVIKEKFKILLSQDQVPDDLHAKIMAISYESLQHIDSKDSLNQNIIPFSGKNKQHISNDSSETDTIKPSKTHYLSIAAAIGAIALGAVLYYQKNSLVQESPILITQEPSIQAPNPVVNHSAPKVEITHTQPNTTVSTHTDVVEKAPTISPNQPANLIAKNEKSETKPVITTIAPPISMNLIEHDDHTLSQANEYTLAPASSEDLDSTNTIYPAEEIIPEGDSLDHIPNQTN